MTEQTYTAEQAREALELMYDCARMEIGDDAIAPRKVLEAFIGQAAQMMREREPVKVTDEDVEACAKVYDECWSRAMHNRDCMRAALESFAARPAAVPDYRAMLIDLEGSVGRNASGAGIDLSKRPTDYKAGMYKAYSHCLELVRKRLAAAPEVTK